MPKTGLWRISNNKPVKLTSGNVLLEQQLEQWIIDDPKMVQGDLEVVAKQMQVSDAKRLDVLALNPQGEWVVIEIKRNEVYRAAVMQAIDYAASIALMPFEELAQKANMYLGQSGKSLQELLDKRGVTEDAHKVPRIVRMLVVGVGRENGLDRMIKFLAENHGVPIQVISYEVFDIGNGEQIIIRELNESDNEYSAVEENSAITIDSLKNQAESAGIGQEFQAILQTAQKHGLYPRPKKWCMIYAPPTNRTRTLFTIWTHPNASGELQTWVGSEVFSEFYSNISDSDAVMILGEQGWKRIPKTEVSLFVNKLDQIFEKINSTK